MKATMLHVLSEAHHCERSAPSSGRGRGVRAQLVPAVDADGSLTTRGPPGPTLLRHESRRTRGDMSTDIDPRF